MHTALIIAGQARQYLQLQLFQSGHTPFPSVHYLLAPALFIQTENL